MLYSDSMPTPLPYLRTILETARESGRSEREISRSATGQAAAISLIKTGRIPSVERVRRLCDALDLEFYIGPRRDRPSPSAQKQAQPESEIRTPRIDFFVLPQVEGFVVGIQEECFDKASLAASLVSETGGIGKPTGPCDVSATRPAERVEIELERVGGHLAFRRDWLDRRLMDPIQCFLLGVLGHSMEPTVPYGSSILVDCARRTRRKGGVFVVRMGGQTLLKRAGEGTDGQWLLVSDHPDWPDVPWPDGAEVVGEVRWIATQIA